MLAMTWLGNIMAMSGDNQWSHIILQQNLSSEKQGSSTWIVPARRRGKQEIGTQRKVRAPVPQWQSRDLAQEAKYIHSLWLLNPDSLFVIFLTSVIKKPQVRLITTTKKISKPQYLSKVFNQSTLGCLCKRIRGFLVVVAVVVAVGFLFVCFVVGL